MGQAQLLLIVLGTVVVGLAVMAGINAYEQNNIKSDLDAVVHECMRLASDAQTLAQKPVAFGGLLDPDESTFDWADQGTNTTITLAMFGWQSPAASSTITLNTTSATTFDATCTSRKFVDGTNANTAKVTVTGVGADDIATVTTLYDPSAGTGT